MYINDFGHNFGLVVLNPIDCQLIMKFLQKSHNFKILPFDYEHFFWSKGIFFCLTTFLQNLNNISFFLKKKTVRCCSNSL